MKAKNIIFKKVESNEVFTALQNNVDVLSELTGSIPSNSSYGEIASLVGKNGKFIVNDHPVITLELPNHANSILRIAPKGSDGIEITRILVDETQRGKNIGSFLINTLFLFLLETLGYIPPISLECTGNISNGNVLIENPIQNQTKFFRKFGFRVTVSKYYPYYVRMDHFQDKFLLDNDLNEPIGIAA
jgi:GNAT superfamily N-acetyltransferase